LEKHRTGFPKHLKSEPFHKERGPWVGEKETAQASTEGSHPQAVREQRGRKTSADEKSHGIKAIGNQHIKESNRAKSSIGGARPKKCSRAKKQRGKAGRPDTWSHLLTKLFAGQWGGDKERTGVTHRTVDKLQKKDLNRHNKKETKEKKFLRYFRWTRAPGGQTE